MGRANRSGCQLSSGIFGAFPKHKENRERSIIFSKNALATSIRMLTQRTRIGTILTWNRSFADASGFLLIVQQLTTLHRLALRKTGLFTASAQFTIENLVQFSRVLEERVHCGHTWALLGQASSFNLHLQVHSVWFSVLNGCKAAIGAAAPSLCSNLMI